MSLPYRVSFVCTGNICRSPMGEAVLRRRLAEAGLDGDVVVDSYGTSGWHVGEPADPRAVAALHRGGYDVVHTARQWRAELFAGSDLVIALDGGHLRELTRMAPTARDARKVRLLRSFDPDADGDLDVPDPYYGGSAAFDNALRLTEAACAGLVGELRRVVSARAPGPRPR